MKTFIVFFLSSISLFAQDKIGFFKKKKQEYCVSFFHKEVYKNPSLMRSYGQYKISKIKTIYTKSKDEFNQIQKPDKATCFSFSATSFIPLDSVKALWGSASYTNKNEKNIKWNESIDYDIIAPYITADSIGGKMDKEVYSFLGGYAKKYKKIAIGLALNYKANLSSRNKDPRPKNISSRINLKFGVNFTELPVNLGFYVDGQKYTQSNDLVFYNEITRPPVYHLNGLGYFNYILKGSKDTSKYEGYGYSVGSEITSKEKEIILTFDFHQLKITKLIRGLDNYVEIAKLTNKDLNINLVKLFYSRNNTLGLKLNYERKTKKGLDPLLSSRSIGGLNVLHQNENYNLVDDILEFSGLFYTDNSHKLIKISPYINYRKYRENYSLINSFQYFDYVKTGVKSNFLYKIDAKNIFSFSSDVNYQKTIKKNTLLRDDGEVSISDMMKKNAYFLSEDKINTKIALEYNYQLKTRINLFFGIESNLTVLDSRLNGLYAFSTGMSF